MTPSRVCTLAPDICVIKSNFALLDVCHFHSWEVVAHTSRTRKVETADPSEFSLVSTKQVTHVPITQLTTMITLSRSSYRWFCIFLTWALSLRQVTDPSNPDSKHQVLSSLVL